jgi:hypothetical protein
VDYFFADHRRWVGWFENPNHFSAWLALMAPWLWALTRWSWTHARTKSRCAWLAFGASYIADVAVLIALAVTYSRGGWVAWIAAALVWMGVIRVWRSKAEAIGMGLRALFAAGAIFYFSAHERLDPAGWAQDRSVGNRLELWQGAMHMMADRPWTGWGAGQSGWVYCEAYQPVEREEIYRTCVNSYLTLGAERGLWFFMLLVGLAVAPLARLMGGTTSVSSVVMRSTRRWTLPWLKGRFPDGALDSNRWLIWQSAAVASWVAWAVANGFSTLIEVRGLWLWMVPVFIFAYMRLPWRRAVGIGAAGALVSGALVIGVVGLRPSPVRVDSGEGWWRFTASGSAKQRVPWLVLPDERVLGPVPGREARRLAMARTDLEIWLPQVPAPFVDRKRIDEGRSSVRILPRSGGTAWARAWILGASTPPPGVSETILWRLHPLGWPSDEEPLGSGIILPQQAGAGELLAWRRWAEERGVRIVRSGVGGADIRARWPWVVNQDIIEIRQP